MHFLAVQHPAVLDGAVAPEVGHSCQCVSFNAVRGRPFVEYHRRQRRNPLPPVRWNVALASPNCLPDRDEMCVPIKPSIDPALMPEWVERRVEVEVDTPGN